MAALLAVSGVGFAASAAQASPLHLPKPGEPDFGPNVTIVDPSWSVADINKALAAAGGESEFSTNRHAVLFQPGTYGSATGTDGSTQPTADLVNGAVGYYDQVAGLGASPDDVTINGAIHSDGQANHQAMPWAGGETALTNFWRSLSNVKINPIQKATEADIQANTYVDGEFPGVIPGVFTEGDADAGQLTWAVSQAAPLRRVDVAGNLSLFPRFGGYSSGGYLADSKVSGQVISGSQQQWYTRDSSIGSWNGSVWNMVFSGVQGAPAQSFPTPPMTTLATTPVTRDAPFLYYSGGQYRVFVPKARANTSGVNWSTDASAGRSLPISDAFIAKPSDSVQKINSALAQGKSLILTPGVYRYAQPIEVKRADTVVLGLGLPTLVPTRGNAALTTADVRGSVISGITVDAGAKKSAVLIQLGSRHGDSGRAHESQASDPALLSDVFVRVGGAEAGSVDTAIEVNSSHVILDDIWSWRADHGTGVGWTQNTANSGLVVNGDDVTATGLFVEHYQKNQVVWNGERGTTVFYQSELPYDVPNQAAWTDRSGRTARDGYASYRVGDRVRTHTAYGLGVYSYFNQGVDIVEASAIQGPTAPDVRFADMVTRFLDGSGSITHVINDQGAAVRLAQPGEDANVVETSYLTSN
ncbi:adenylyl cyclase [Gryllotalpicola daejeonensis]